MILFDVTKILIKINNNNNNNQNSNNIDNKNTIHKTLWN